jgi:poly(A) polymerase
MQLASELEIVRRLRDAGHAAFLVGGCVRDRLLGLPVKDFDVATSATPSQVLNLFPGSNEVGAHFGVVLVGPVEVATFRSDSSYGDGRHPDAVHFETDPRQDVLRRDFTINALLMDPDTGAVLDYVNGRPDLEARIIRTVGEPEQRFAEDHLRMLRAVRFAARFGFTIEGQTMAAIQRHSHQIASISPERIRDELTRILTQGNPRRGFELLDESGLLQHVLPEIAAMKGVEQPPEFHPEGDVWIHTLIMLENLENPEPALAWGVLLHDVGKPPTFRVADRIRFDGHVEAGVQIAEAILKRLNFSNELIERIIALIAQHMRFGAVQRMRESTLKRFLRQEHFEQHMELHRVDCLSSHGKLDNYDFLRQKLQDTPPERLRPVRLLTGTDLVQAGYQPGPLFRTILEAVETAQLEGAIHTRDEALAIAARYKH